MGERRLRTVTVATTAAAVLVTRVSVGVTRVAAIRVARVAAVRVATVRVSAVRVTTVRRCRGGCSLGSVGVVLVAVTHAQAPRALALGQAVGESGLSNSGGGSSSVRLGLDVGLSLMESHLIGDGSSVSLEPGLSLQNSYQY